MLDGLSLDLLRVFIAAADEGSFSAAARRFNRAQSAVSDMVGKLEEQVGVPLFDRGGRYPKLTPAGGILLADARAVVAGVDVLRARAKGMAKGLEPELAIVVDVMFPIAVMSRTARVFAEMFPNTPLRLDVEALGGAYRPLLDRRASLGVLGTLSIMPPALVSERIRSVPYVMVAAAAHPLAARPGPIARAELARHVQLVLTDRSELSQGQSFLVLSQANWRLADLSAKHAFLLDGLGWGGMPRHVVEADIAAGRLVVLDIEDMPSGAALAIPMAVAYRADSPPGPAGRWLADWLKHGCTRAVA